MVTKTRDIACISSDARTTDHLIFLQKSYYSSYTQGYQFTDFPKIILSVSSLALTAVFDANTSLADANMGYIMKFYVDGGCRGNGQPGAYGAAAAVLMRRFGGNQAWTRRLPSSQVPSPTNQRAEITAIILALEQALDKYEDLDTSPYLDLTIHSDSRYAIGCMTDWIYKWCRNDWTNAAGNEVANRDLIEKASRLDDKVKELGEVTYMFVPREENQDADRYCNDEMDEM